MREISIALATVVTVMLVIFRVEPATAAQISIIPQPAGIEPRPGVFVIRAGTRLSIPRDPRAARVAHYFASLLQETSGMKLTGTGGAHSIAFELAPKPSNPEAYSIDITP